MNDTNPSDPDFAFENFLAERTDVCVIQCEARIREQLQLLKDGLAAEHRRQVEHIQRQTSQQLVAVSPKAPRPTFQRQRTRGALAAAAAARARGSSQVHPEDHPEDHMDSDASKFESRNSSSNSNPGTQPEIELLSPSMVPEAPAMAESVLAVASKEVYDESGSDKSSSVASQAIKRMITPTEEQELPGSAMFCAQTTPHIAPNMQHTLVGKRMNQRASSSSLMIPSSLAAPKKQDAQRVIPIASQPKVEDMQEVQVSDREEIGSKFMRLDSNCSQISSATTSAPPCGNVKGNEVRHRVSFSHEAADPTKQQSELRAPPSRKVDRCSSNVSFNPTALAQVVGSYINEGSETSINSGSDGLGKRCRDSNDLKFDLLPAWNVNAKRSLRNNTSKRVSKVQLLDEDRASLGEGEELGRWDVRKFMIHPNSLSHIIWNFTGLIFILYDCLMVPLEVFEPRENHFTSCVAWATRIFWTANIPVSFLTGYVRPTGSVEMSPSKCSKRYFATWFPPDIFVVACDWMEVLAVMALAEISGVSSSLRTVRVFRMLRAVRVFRLIKAQYISDFVSENIRSERLLLLATIVRIMFIMLAFTHLITCSYWGIGIWHKGGVTWIVAQGMRERTMEVQYMTCFHWALSTLTGGTLISPQNFWELTFTVVILFATFVVGASFVSSITTAMTRMQILSNEDSRKISVLKRYLSDHNISQQLKIRVQRNAQHALTQHQKNMPENQVELLKMISEPLRVELHFEVHATTLMIHPFFLCYNDVNSMGLRKVAHVAVEPFNISSGDVLFTENEEPQVPRMFFVLNGRLMYEQEWGKTQVVDGGAWMCEGCLWTNWVHCGTLRALSESQMLCLDAKKFQDAFKSFQQSHGNQYGTAFVDWLNAGDRSSLSDIGDLSPGLENVTVQAFPFYGMDDEENSSSSDDEESKNTVGELRQNFASKSKKLKRSKSNLGKFVHSMRILGAWQYVTGYKKKQTARGVCRFDQTESNVVGVNDCPSAPPRIHMRLWSSVKGRLTVTERGSANTSSVVPLS